MPAQNIRKSVFDKFLKNGRHLHIRTALGDMEAPEYKQFLGHDDSITSPRCRTTTRGGKIIRVHAKNIWDDEAWLSSFLNVNSVYGTPSRQLTTGTSTMTDQAQVEADPGTSTT